MKSVWRSSNCGVLPSPFCNVPAERETWGKDSYSCHRPLEVSGIFSFTALALLWQMSWIILINNYSNASGVQRLVGKFKKNADCFISSFRVMKQVPKMKCTYIRSGRQKLGAGKLPVPLTVASSQHGYGDNEFFC